MRAGTGRLGAVVLVTAVGCGDRASDSACTDPLRCEPLCHLILDPSSELDFGTVAPGATASEGLYASGRDGGCEIASVETAPPFRVSFQGPVGVESGAQLTIGVYFEPGPEPSVHTGQLTVRSDDPEQPVHVVALVGEVAQGD